MDKRQQDSFKHYFYKFQPLFLMISSVVPYSWEGGLGGLGWKVRANCIEGLCNRCRPFPWWLTTFHANITPRATWKYKKAYEYFWKELLLEKLGVLKIKKKKMFNYCEFQGATRFAVGLPSWSSGWESTCQCRGHGFNLQSGKIAHAAEKRSPCSTTTEPTHV